MIAGKPVSDPATGRRASARRPSRAGRSWTSEEALLAHEPRVALVATPSASRDLRVRAPPAHDLPGADPDARGEVEARDLLVRDRDKLGPLSNRQAPSLALQRVRVAVDVDPLPLSHHGGGVVVDEAHRARVALERPGPQWREHEGAVVRVFQVDRHALLRGVRA